MINPKNYLTQPIIQNNGNRTREIHINQPSGITLTYSDELEKKIKDYESSKASLSETVAVVASASLETLGGSASKSDITNIAEIQLQAVLSRYISGLQNGGFKINPKSHLNKKNNLLTANTTETQASAFSDEIIKLIENIEIRGSISCHDIHKIKDIANTIIVDESSPIKNSELEIVLLVKALSKSKSTMSNSMNKIINLFENFIEKHNAESIKNNDQLLSLYIMASSEYLKLASNGAISTASISKKTINSIVKTLTSLETEIIDSMENGNIDDPSNPSGQIANLFTSALSFQIRAKTGLKSCIAIRSAIGSIFSKLGNECSKRKELSSSTAAIIALGMSSTMPVFNIQKLKSLKIANDRLEKIENVFYVTLLALRNAVENKITSIVNDVNEQRIISANSSKNGIMLNSEMYLLESRLETLISTLVSECTQLISQNDFSTIERLLCSISKIRNIITEEDGRDGETVKQRDIYGINDLQVKKISQLLLSKLNNNDLSIEQNVHIINALCFIMQGMYAKQRNKVIAPEFLQNDLLTSVILGTIIKNMHRYNENTHVALELLPAILSKLLLDIENTDITSTQSSTISSSILLMQISIGTQIVELENAIKEKNITSITRIQRLLAHNLGIYAFDFIFSQDKNIAKSNAINLLSALNMDNKSILKNPLMLSASISLLRTLIITTISTGYRMTPAKQMLVEMFSNMILNRVKVLPSAIMNCNYPLGDEEKNNITSHIASSISSMQLDAIADESHASSGVVGILYLATCLSGDMNQMKIIGSKFNESVEHQSNHLCLTTNDIENLSLMLKGEREEIYT